MSTFARSQHVLGADSLKRSIIGLMVVVALLTLWIVWFFCAPITLYETSMAAHLEVIPVDGALNHRHRLSGTVEVEVEVERVTPATLVLRAIGRAATPIDGPAREVTR
jgi:hypothetical protein